MSQKTLNLCLERYSFVKFGETTKSSHTVLCINNAYSVNSDKYRLTPTAIASKHGEGYVFTLNYDFDRPLFTIVQKSYTLNGTSGNIVFEGIDPISKGSSKYLRKVTVSPVKLSDGSYLLEVTNDEYLRIGTTGAALGDEDLESLNEKIMATGGISKSVETVGGKQVLKLDASDSVGAKEIVYFDVDPSDPPSGIYDDIAEVLSNGKLPAIRSNGKLYQYSSTDTDFYTFVGEFSNDGVGYESFKVYTQDYVQVDEYNASLGFVTVPENGTAETPAWAKVCELEPVVGSLAPASYITYGLALLFNMDRANNNEESITSGMFVLDVGTKQRQNSNGCNASWMTYTPGTDENSKILGVKLIAKYGVPSNPAYAPYPVYKVEVWVKYYGSNPILVNALQNAVYNYSYGMIQNLYKFPENHMADTQTTEPLYADTEEYKYRNFFYPAESPSVAYTYSQSLTSDQKAQGRDNIGAASASDVTALQSQVSSLSDVSAYTVKGEATVAQLNAGPSGIQAGWAYQLTDSGTLTAGSLAVVAGDTVAWDGTKWFPLVKNDYYATKTYAQNVAHSIAPEFDPTRTSENPYKAGESVTYTDGKVYTFTVDHYGAWNASDVASTNLPKISYFINPGKPSDNKLSSLRFPGVYKISSSDMANMVDAPTDYGFSSSACLVVIPTNGAYTIQYLFKSTGNAFFKRTSDTGVNPVASEWTRGEYLAKSDFYHGNVYSKLGYTTLKQCRDSGFYGAETDDVSHITDLPSNYPSTQFFTLSVIPYNTYYNLQVLNSRDGRTWIRNSPGPNQSGAETAWIDTTSHNMLFGQVYSDLDYTTLKECRDCGFYGVQTTELQYITDLPSDYPSGQFLSLSVLPINVSYNLQVIQSRDFKTWKRISPAIGSAEQESAWVETFSKEDLFYKSIYSDLGYTKLEDCVEYGFYGITTADVSHITDLPTGYDTTKFFTLAVVPANYSYYNFQILLSRDNKIYQRLSHSKGSSQSATDWTNVVGVFLGKVYSDFGYTTLKQCRELGFYGSNTSDSSHITDLPSDYDTTKKFSLSVLPINASYNLQVLQSEDFKTWKRISPAIGSAEQESAWQYIGSSLITSTTRYVALGDSITQGWWSDDNGDYHAPTAGINWPEFVGEINGYSVTNAALGGSGYARKAGGTGNNGKDIVDTIDFSNYDLVSIAYGINDWKYVEDLGDISTSTVGDGTMVGNMRYCVEKILNDNPSIKIVIIGPFNCSIYGNFNINWSLGYALANGTLQDCIDKIKAVCDYYNLQYVDCISNNIVTRLTVPDIFKDGVHPKQDYILKMAKSFARQLMYS